MIETNNPYRSALRLLRHRLLWDLRPESWRSRRKIRAWKDRLSGRKAVVLCNGPSLLESDLSLLAGTFCFGLNKINLLFDKVDFRPSCIVAVNPYVLEQNAGFYNQTDLPLFLGQSAVKSVSAREHVCFLHTVCERGFSGDCSISVDQGHTVTFVALQLAYHMGFQDVALIGCDHNFAVQGTPNEVVVSGEVDASHFDPNYFAGGRKWQLPDLPQSEVSYILAGQAFNVAGRRVVNATEGGNLEIFPRVSLTDFVASSPE